MAAIHSPDSDRHLEHKEKKDGMGYVNIGHFRMKLFRRLCDQVAHEEMVFMWQSTEGAILEKPSVYDVEGSRHKELKCILEATRIRKNSAEHFFFFKCGIPP